MCGLFCWSHLLKGATIPILVFTDHANLQYYQEPRKIGPCIAGYLPEREQYNIILEYKPGATNCTDALSRRPDYEGPNPTNDDITVWPDHYYHCRASGGQPINGQAHVTVTCFTLCHSPPNEWLSGLSHAAADHQRVHTEGKTEAPVKNG